jgi:hypothetical protein
MDVSTEVRLNQRKKTIIVMTILIVLMVSSGFSIRLINLGQTGFGTDEPLHVFAAKSILETGKPNMPSGYPYDRALLYTKLVSNSFRIFGISEFSARLPSVVFSTLTIVLVFFAGKILFGTSTGVISALLFTFSPFAILYARECRMYSMFQFFYLFGTLAFFLGFENLRFNNMKKPYPLESCRSFSKFFKLINKGWGLNFTWLIVAIVLFYISLKLHALTVLFGAGLLIYLALMVRLSSSDDESFGEMKKKYSFSLIVLIVFGFLAVVTNPLLIGLIKESISPSRVGAWYSGMSFNPIYYLIFLGSTAVFPIGAFFILGGIQIIIRNYKPGLYALVCVVVPFTIISLIKFRGIRYIFHIFPLVVLIAGYSISLILQYESKMLSNIITQKHLSKNAKFISAVLIAAVLIAVSSPWINHIYRFTVDYYHEEAQFGSSHRNWKDACKFVRDARGPEDTIITSEPLNASFYNCGDIEYVFSKNPNRKYGLNNIKNIGSLNDLKEAIYKNQSGWIIIDAGRLNSRRFIQKEMRDFMTKNLSQYIIDPHGTIFVFNWDKEFITNYQNVKEQ